MDDLTWEDTAPLGEALSHPSPAVRLASLRALARLPLETDIWLELRDVVLDLLRQERIGDDSTTATVAGLPFAEVLRVAILIPVQSVRDSLHRLLGDPDEHVRRSVARLLAAAGDQAAVLPLVDELAAAVGGEAVEAAEWLAQLDVSGHVAEIAVALERSTDPDASFWLALALARTGSSAPLERILLDLAAGKIELHSTWGDPQVFLDKLNASTQLPDGVRDRLEQIVGEVPPESWAAQIATELSKSPGELKEIQPDSPSPAEQSGAELALQSIAAEVARRLRTGSGLTEQLLQIALRTDLLAYLPPELAGKLVTALFASRASHPAEDAGGNEIVQAIYHVLPNSFAPDIRGLFEVYATLWAPEDLAQLRPSPWGLRWQIGWTVSRAGLAAIIQGLAEPLQGQDVPEIILAARLVEDAARFREESFPPIFGGGGEPPESLPDRNLIDDAGYGGGRTAANGGARAKPQDGTGSNEKDRSGRGDVGAGGMEQDPTSARREEEKDKGPVHRGLGPGTSFGLEDFAYDDETADPGEGEEGKEGSTRDGPAARERKVNTGFSAADEQARDLEKNLPLKTGARYYFWMSIGQRDDASLETGPSPEVHVPLEARITVALFSFTGGLVLTDGADIGELNERGGQFMQPVRQPLGEGAPEIAKSAERLYFPVQTPEKPGEYRMRCNLYWGQILLQSRLIEVLVEVDPVSRGENEAVLRVTPDYTIAPSLDPAHLRQLPEHRLSILLNQNQDGTHSFHFLGAEDGRVIKNDDIRYGEGELTDLISIARRKLRRASWGTEEEWNGEDYLYRDRKIRLDRLKPDLINLAQWGYDFYAGLLTRLTGRSIDPYTLSDLMKAPGVLQIAMKESPSYVLPVAMIYDAPLDVEASTITLCQTFEKALLGGQDLENTLCFKGKCPSWEDDTVVCPSGFWGFRHYLGMPLTVVDREQIADPTDDEPRDVPPSIDVEGTLRVAAAVATDLAYEKKHISNLQKLWASTELDYADTREEVFAALKGTPHLVYFYCHGGYTGGEPYLQVGGEGTVGKIVPSNILAKRIRWKKPRPLVFINGCHTTSVEPVRALEFISPLVSLAGCAGVIGTEITIFEDLATVFAEACLQHFYAGESIGVAVRNARLALLQEGNPLGLVYIPFVLAGLRLVDRSRELPLPSGSGGGIEYHEDHIDINGITLPINDP